MLYIRGVISFANYIAANEDTKNRVSDEIHISFVCSLFPNATSYIFLNISHLNQINGLRLFTI